MVLMLQDCSRKKLGREMLLRTEADVPRLNRSSGAARGTVLLPFGLNYSFGAQLFDVRVIVAEFVENLAGVLAE
jgi:hypothetical protein